MNPYGQPQAYGTPYQDNNMQAMGGNPYPPMPYAQPVQPVVMGQPIIAQPILVVGNNTTPAACSFCRSQRTPTHRRASGEVTFLWALGLCLLCWPLTCVPFCVDSCKDIEIVCPDCANIRGIIPARCCN